MSRLEEFESHIAADGKIEPDDWMPEKYRQAVEQIVGFHAVAEVLSYGPFFYGWALRGPSLRRKLIVNAFIQDELGHGQSVLRVWESLGRTYEDLVRDFREGKLRILNAFLYGLHDWCEYAVFGMFGDSLELDRLSSLRQCSYGPYARCLNKVVKEEAFHFRQSCDAVRVIMDSGTDQQKHDVQGAVNKWWPRIMRNYGPPDAHIDSSKNTMFRWKLKIKKNDELRQEFLKRTVPLFAEWGLSLPDPNLSFDNKSERWSYSEPDFEQLKRDQSERGAELEQYIRYAELGRDHVRRDQPILPRSWRNELAWPRYAASA